MEDKEKKVKQKSDTIVINKKSLKNNLIRIVSFLILLVIVVPITMNIVRNQQEGKLYNIRSEKHLKKLVSINNEENTWLKLFLYTPFAIKFFDYYYPMAKMESMPIAPTASADSLATNKSESITSSSDYSKTNVQVENIDEADVVKTDGGYVYSISENKVVITDVLDKKNPKIVAKLESDSTTYPMEILISGNKLIIISTSVNNWRTTSSKTSIYIYDITNKSDPKRIKSLNLNSKYNTSRVLNNKVYIFASQDISYDSRREDSRKYTEDFKNKEIPFNKMKYLKNQRTSELTTFVCFDLNEITKDVNISAYLVDMDNVYVSYENFYILSTNYGYREEITAFDKIKKICGFKGLFGIDDLYENNNWNWRNSTTKISKYQFVKDGEIKFIENAKVKGKILNQYSCDEKDGNLRIALNNSEGTRIVVLDKDLKEIGDTGPVAPGEDNKSVRFTGNRAYFVTYKQVDPLYVIDLSNPRDPTIMGELKIPGFSNYLHPYDDNNIIGIGMATNEKIIRDSFGRPISENITFNGMKMTIFDISDVRNPKEKDVVYFGDTMTNSQINKNAKALLFSKEKNLIAIPVSNMGNTIWWDIPLTNDEMMKYGLKEKPVVQEKVIEGYIVYNITLDGFKYKGIITHDGATYETKNSYYYQRDPLRGLYIDNNLITVSNSLLKINDLITLQFISNINLISNENIEKEVGNTYLSNELKNILEKEEKDDKDEKKIKIDIDNN